ncbi:uncharacterized protein LOC141588027 [Silene latifolia]|uniref:uncharacterized protein LOC141588027 n=1 Tax=Silene latifolia TaxID=37657 RepID=UPI003D77F194
MRKDAVDYANKCDAYQRHAPVSRTPASSNFTLALHEVGMDIVGTLPRAPRNNVYMLAMTSYFFKWIEAHSSSQVTENQVVSFSKRNIICRFGIPSEIICDNGSQFISHKSEAFVPGGIFHCKSLPPETLIQMDMLSLVTRSLWRT